MSITLIIKIKIFNRYLVAVSDVLTSVQKTEESLKRLRKDRTTTTSTGISDDDKIRMQLVIDVDAFVEQSTCLLDDSPPEMKALRDVVEPARQVFRRSQFSLRGSSWPSQRPQRGRYFAGNVAWTKRQ